MSYDPGKAPTCPLHNVKCNIIGTSSPFRFVCPIGNETYDWHGTAGSRGIGVPFLNSGWGYNPAGWSAPPGPQVWPGVPGLSP